MGLPYTKRLAKAPDGVLYVLEPHKAERMKAATMYVPSPADIAGILNRIPAGTTISHDTLKEQLATFGKADIACPMMTTRYWSWIAAASAEPDYALSSFQSPWWRVIKHGKPVKTLPGGDFSQEARLRAEGEGNANTN
jgi:hypothetical protein